MFFIGGLFSLWKDLGDMLAAEFIIGGNGDGDEHLTTTVTPEMVCKKNLYIYKYYIILSFYHFN